MTYDNRKENCPKCNKKVVKQYLNAHIKHIHDKIKDYKCDTCDSSFAKSDVLQAHISAIHKKEKNHKCKQCGKSFGLYVNLRRHEKSIHGENKFECNQCGKRFNLNQNLQRHIKTVHEDLKAFQCHRSHVHIMVTCAKGNQTRIVSCLWS